MPEFVYDDRKVEFTGTYTGGYDCINRGAFYEQAFLEHVRSLGLSGTYLDIGTNIGNHALYFAMFCPSQRVIGFEPMTHWRARAIANMAANGCDGKVEIKPFGLLDRDEQLEFNPYGTPFVLDCKTLDEVLPDLADVSFVKMDIEGSEPRALLGGADLFRRNRPVIYAEVLGDADALLAAAATIGYRHSGEIFTYACSPMYALVPAD
jgi:hypothetical protein